MTTAEPVAPPVRGISRVRAGPADAPLAGRPSVATIASIPRRTRPTADPVVMPAAQRKAARVGSAWTLSSAWTSMGAADTATTTSFVATAAVSVPMPTRVSASDTQTSVAGVMFAVRAGAANVCETRCATSPVTQAITSPCATAPPVGTVARTTIQPERALRTGIAIPASVANSALTARLISRRTPRPLAATASASRAAAPVRSAVGAIRILPVARIVCPVARERSVATWVQVQNRVAFRM